MKLAAEVGDSALGEQPDVICPSHPDWKLCASIEQTIAALDRLKRTELARRIWLEQTRPARGTVVEDYLSARGVTIPLPHTIRYAPRLRHPSGEIFEAMISAAQDIEGRLVAIHRTYLYGAAKANVRPNKMTLGPIRGAAVRLAIDAAEESVVLCEGLESGLSFQQATGDPVWVALGTSNLSAMELPSEVRTVVIAADSDAAGRRAAREAADIFMRQGRRVLIASPPTDLDFNDVLLRKAVST
jgi:DNA primase